MGEKVWQKFHPVFGSDLKVGFETTFPRNAVLGVDSPDSLYEKNCLIYDSGSGPVKRIYEPAVKIIGSCLDGEAAQVFFEPVSQAGSLFRRLVFARKVEHSTQEPRHWMVAARHSEVAHFGFDSWNSKDQRYLSLAYPGLEEQFKAVYFKIQNGKEEKEKSFIYLEVLGLDDEVQVLVVARRVEEKKVPEHLRSAKPEI